VFPKGKNNTPKNLQLDKQSTSVRLI